MSRMPIRVRVTAAFAVAMAAVLAGSGWFLYARLDSHLATGLDRELQVRSQDLAALVRQPNGVLATDSAGRFIERGERVRIFSARKATRKERKDYENPKSS